VALARARHFCCLQFAKKEQVLDQLLQALCAFLDLSEHTPLSLVQGPQTRITEQIGVPQNGNQGRLELMGRRDEGKEFRLHCMMSALDFGLAGRTSFYYRIRRRSRARTSRLTSRLASPNSCSLLSLRLCLSHHFPVTLTLNRSYLPVRFQCPKPRSTAPKEN